MFESRKDLALAGGGLAIFSAIGSYITYAFAQAQCSPSGSPPQELLANRNSVCRILGMPMASDTGSHLILAGVMAAPPVIAMLGTIGAVRRRSARLLAIAGILCAVAWLGLLIFAGQANVSVDGG